jgi:integrase
MDDPTSPHAIRHAAITRTDKLNNGNLTETQALGRHRDPRTTQKYIDANRDSFGKAARRLAADK